MTTATPPARRKTAVILLALAGGGIATVLALFQVGVVEAVWEPFFGEGSRRVLTSPLSRALPVPDAALGAVTYLAEAVLAGIARPDRPRIVLAAGAVAAGLALAALGLIAAQVLLVGAFCTLCLVSAALSLAIGALAVPEVRDALTRLRRSHR